MRLRVALATLALALTLAPLAAPLLAASHPFAALLIRNFFSRLCHQDPSRSFVVDGSAVAVCVRCLGIYWGVAVGMVVRLRRARWLLTVAVVLNLVDVATGVVHWHGNLPLVRFFLGFVLGVGVGTVLFFREGLGPLRLVAHPSICGAVKRTAGPSTALRSGRDDNSVGGRDVALAAKLSSRPERSAVEGPAVSSSGLASRRGR